MGTITQGYAIVAKSPSEAYEILCARARDAYGHQEGYSGEINCTNGFTMTKLDQKKFTRAALHRWYEYWEEHCKKRDAVCLELPRSHSKGAPRGCRKYVFVAACPS